MRTGALVHTHSSDHNELLLVSPKPLIDWHQSGPMDHDLAASWCGNGPLPVSQPLVDAHLALVWITSSDSATAEGGEYRVGSISLCCRVSSIGLE